MRELLAGGRVQLRPWQPGDVDTLVAHANDAAVSRGLSTRFPYPYTRAERGLLAITCADSRARPSSSITQGA